MNRRIPSLLQALRPAVLATAVFCFVGSAAAEDLWDGFAAYVDQAVTDWEVPGLAIAVVKDDAVVFTRGYGTRTLGRDEPVGTGTRFAIGSTTKAMTAAAVGMLVDEGKLGWDDKVQEHLSNYQLADPYVSREITVRDLLAHRTGVGNADFLWYEQERKTSEILERMRFIEQGASLRSRFIYHNVMYGAAGEVVAAISGRSWAEFVRRRIVEPLGMNNTLVIGAKDPTSADIAAPHDRVDGELRLIENASVAGVAAAGSVWSSVDDMAKWLRFLLAGGVTAGGKRLLEEATVEEIFTPQTIVGRRSFYPTARLTRPHWTTYGLGWFQADYRGRAVDFHTGSIDGMVAIVGLIRDEDLGAVVLANRDHAEIRHALMYRVFDLYGEGESRDWSADLRELYDTLEHEAEERQEARDAERVTGTRPSLDLESYAGSYEHEAYGAVEVRAAEDGAELRARLGGLVGDLEHWHYDTFVMSFDAAWRGRLFVSFVLGRNGRPAALEAGFARFERTAAADP